ncbi:MAG: pH regulation protein F [Sphaerochaetaceae bacterium]|nr:pH regulation protein F [Sphaerochaetaceae bacterium]
MWAQYLLLFFAAASAVKILIGPTGADRLIALMILSSVTLGFLVLTAVAKERLIYLDVALVYDIFGFLGLLAIARFLPRSLMRSQDKETGKHVRRKDEHS